MAITGVKELFQGVPYYIYIANRSAKAVSLMKHIKVATPSSALPHVIYAQRVETDEVDKPRFHSTTHANGEWVEGNKLISSARLQTP